MSTTAPQFGAENTPKRQEVFAHQWYTNQIKVFDSYQSPPTQYFVAFIIILNFFIQCWKREYDPGCSWEEEISIAPCNNQQVWSFWSWFFNITFLVELLWNLAGSWVRPFLGDSWNYFDCVVVALGVVDMAGVPLGNLKLLRMLRAFRIFRLFGRVKSLRKIISSLFNASAGVGNAFLIVFIVMSIYAVLAVDLFGDAMCAQNGTQLEDWDSFNVHGGTCFGMGYYGTFITSLYTMFQILTGESWSEGCVWPLLDYYSATDYYSPLGPHARKATMLFFVTFVIITNFILLNVIVTVLIDGMNQAVDEPHPEKSEPEGRDALLQMIAKLQENQAQHQTDLDQLVKAVGALPASP